jgi:hypothetical protein
VQEIEEAAADRGAASDGARRDGGADARRGRPRHDAETWSDDAALSASVPPRDFIEWT